MRYLLLATILAPSLIGCSVVIDTGDLTFDAGSSMSSAGGGGGATTTATTNTMVTTSGLGGEGGSSTTSGSTTSSMCEEGTYYLDDDGDQFGDPTKTRCGPEQGWVDNADDCDDEDPAIKPGATEVCNGVDDDCDTDTDGAVCPTSCEGAQFGGKVYLLCQKLSDWATAESTCQMSGMNLAKVESLAENTFIQKGGKPISWCPATPGRIWIGGNDTSTEDFWVWADDTTHFFDGETGMCVSGQFCNWKPGEPNDTGGVEDCAMIPIDNGMWNDQDCDNLSCYACESP